MSDAFFKWYRSRSTVDQLRQQIDKFASHAVFLEHPALHTGVLLNVDGDQIHVDTEEVIRLVDMRLGNLTVEWWLSPDVDLTCGISNIPLDCEIQTYYLSGLTYEQMIATARTLSGYAESIPDDTIGYVLDMDGRTAEFDWDSVFVYEGKYDSLLPHTIAAPRSIIDRIGGIRQALTEHRVTEAQVGPDLVRISVQPVQG